MNEDKRYRFDQGCRTKPVELAATRFDFPTERLLFEVTENERVIDREHLEGILKDDHQRGFKTAIDDFEAGFRDLACSRRA